MLITLPLELLTEIFRYNKDDYKTLYYCILVNKQWHNINIPILWRNPFIFRDSTKIIINCLLKEDKGFLTRNSIELTFELLNKSPLYNYARFATILSFPRSCNSHLVTKASELNILRNRLANFVLDHSTTIRELDITDTYAYQDNYNSFWSPNKLDHRLDHRLAYSSEFIDKLANSCKCIQSLQIYNNNKFDCSLTQLVKAQNQIKHLTIHSPIIQENLSDNFKKAILTHSQSIIYYSSNGLNSIDYILLPTLKNLKTLSLTSKIKCLKNISLPNIEFVKLCVYRQTFLSDLSDFINTNGKTLKYLEVSGCFRHDNGFSGKLFQSIARWCENLVNLSIFYNDEVIQELKGVFNNCIKLESIIFQKLPATTLDGDKILLVLNQTLPKKLRSIMFPCKFSIINVNFFDNLMENWRGPKPFTIKFYDYQKLVD